MHTQNHFIAAVVTLLERRGGIDSSGNFKFSQYLLVSVHQDPALEHSCVREPGDAVFSQMLYRSWWR